MKKKQDIKHVNRKRSIQSRHTVIKQGTLSKLEQIKQTENADKLKFMQ